MCHLPAIAGGAVCAPRKLAQPTDRRHGFGLVDCAEPHDRVGWGLGVEQPSAGWLARHPQRTALSLQCAHRRLRDAVGVYSKEAAQGGPRFGRVNSRLPVGHQQGSPYYWWWQYLRRNADYIACCERGGKGRLSKLYKDFGDVREDNFHKWWTEGDRGVELFAEQPLAVRLSELHPADQKVLLFGLVAHALPKVEALFTSVLFPHVKATYR
jgi:hypothetical protein